MGIFCCAVKDAKEKTESWREEYNTFRLTGRSQAHSSLDDLASREFAEQHVKPHGNHSRVFFSATGSENG